MAGTANLARSNVDFPLSIGPVLEALEEQVVMLRLLSDMAADPRGVTVSIGRENPYDGLAGSVRCGDRVRTRCDREGRRVGPHPDGLPDHHGRGPCSGTVPVPDPGPLRIC